MSLLLSEGNGPQYLFLDRDGVINWRIPDSYVLRWKDFHFMEGVLEAMPILARHFERIFVVTNQQGVAKGVMTLEALEHIHKQMIEIVRAHGGRIDKVYASILPGKDNPICRKPNPGMGLDAQRDFPEVDFSRSIMVGDSPTDMRFGKNLGMKTVMVRDHDYPFRQTMENESQFIDQTVDDLYAFAVQYL